MSLRLYLDDPYLTSLTAIVKKAERKGGLSQVILDKTIFFPTSGGQPNDTGWLNGKEVVDVFEEGEEAVHLVKGEIRKKEEVTGEINWHRRFDHMQQHTAQHLLSAVILKLCNLPTIGFHLGSDITTIDLPSSQLSPEMLLRFEDKVNELVMRNIVVKTFLIPREKATEIDLRKREAIPEGSFLRVVEIEGVDRSLCCGTHLARTGELGIIKITHQEKIKGNTRLGFLAGIRALKRYQQEYRLLGELSLELNSGVIELKNAINNLKTREKYLRKEIKALNDKLSDLLVDKMIADAKEINGILVASGIFEGITPDVLKLSAIKGVKKGKALFLIGGTKGGKGNLIFASSRGLGLPLKEAMEQSVELIKGNGGGGDDFASGEGDDASGIEEALLSAKKFLGMD
jgi:alanyl-tRNA synthetase